MTIINDFIIVCDRQRHLICLPYSLPNLHKAADQLNIGRHFFHKDHYDIPAKRVEEITNKCHLVGRKFILESIRVYTKKSRLEMNRIKRMKKLK